ncbi:hypothetical protein F4781DRAFT_437412 [Annulohypoxylon bovei var. microspora]|nr:hypothetical protein F4781DRAFT_437412 [Annulohypoxylon bovei var. microspora]
MEDSTFDISESIDFSNIEHVIIHPFIRDGGISREALNSHRRQLGLGPSKNLISSNAFQLPEMVASYDFSIYKDKLLPPQEDIYPFLNILDLVNPYCDDYDINRTPRKPIPKRGTDNTATSQLNTLHRLGERREHTSTRRYRGNRALSRNRSADIPNEMNCRLWIAKLPPNCTITDLLKEVRDVGPIYATHIVPPLIHDSPTRSRASIPTSAASLTFFTASAANLFLLRHMIHPFTVGGYTTTISRHRVRTKPAPVDGQSRVLVITGDPEVVNPEKLTQLLIERWNIRFDTDSMEYTQGQQSNEIVWAFGSFRAQAQAVYIRLSQYSEKEVNIRYDSDPCA